MVHSARAHADNVWAPIHASAPSTTCAYSFHPCAQLHYSHHLPRTIASGDGASGIARMLCVCVYVCVCHREQLQRDGSWSVVEEMAAQLSELSAPPTTHTLPHTHTPTHTATHGGPIGATEAAGAATNDTATDNNTSGCVRLEEGYAEGLSYMAHLWEPLRWHFRCVRCDTHTHTHTDTQTPYRTHAHVLWSVLRCA